MRWMLMVFLLTALPAQAQESWVVKQSPNDVSATADRLVTAVEEAGAEVVARIDHAANAEKADMALEPTILIIFGNPAIGTPVIAAERRAALDLPVKVLIWREGDATMLGYLNPQSLKLRYGIEGADEALTKMAGALDKLTEAAIAE